MVKQTVIFDLDGTILNTLDDLADAANYALQRCGFAPRTIDEIRRFVGNGIRLLIERSVPAGTAPGGVRQVYDIFNSYYKEHCADKTRPYAGIPEMLRMLRMSGCKTAVLSNKADYAVQTLCRRYFDGLLDAAAGERPGIAKKPAPDAVFMLMHELDAAPERTVYVGDSDVDIETAKNAGLPCISVDWGFRSREFLIAHGAAFIAASPSDILCRLGL